MRSKEEIENEKSPVNSDTVWVILKNSELILEVLLDIREIIKEDCR